VTPDPRSALLTFLAELPKASGRLPQAGRFPILVGPDLSTVSYLKEKNIDDRRIYVITVTDFAGDDWLLIQAVVPTDGGWRVSAGVQCRDRTRRPPPNPSVALSAIFTDSLFLAGGRISSAGAPIARVRLRWGDGTALDDNTDADVVVFASAAGPQRGAVLEFLSATGELLGTQTTLHNDRDYRPG
jgi:hypothetical protein